MMDDHSRRRPRSSPPPLSLMPGPARPTPLPAAEAALTRLALAARDGDRAARDALYRAMTPDLEQMVAACARLAWDAACPRRDGQPWDREDLRQEGYLIFCDLVAAWSGEGPFTRYLFAYFPWRLRNAWRKLRPERPKGEMMRGGLPELAGDPTAVAAEATVLLEELAGHLPAAERAILLGHVRDGLSLAELARRLGVRPRQARRRWHEITRWLRGEIGISPRVSRMIPGSNRSQRGDQ